MASVFVLHQTNAILITLLLRAETSTSAYTPLHNQCSTFEATGHQLLPVPPHEPPIARFNIR